jgi:hypothetical protein
MGVGAYGGWYQRLATATASALATARELALALTHGMSNWQFTMEPTFVRDSFIPVVLHLRQLDGRWGLPWLA